MTLNYSNKNMTNEEILKKAIEKAEKNGFELSAHLISLDTALGHIETSFDTICFLSKEKIIFNHKFAEALWGYEWVLTGEIEGCKKCRTIEKGMRKWRYHLQQMVLKEEPLKYIEQFL